MMVIFSKTEYARKMVYSIFFFLHCRESIFVASCIWNIRSLVECVGDARICKPSKAHLDFLVDRKLNLLVKELQ